MGVPTLVIGAGMGGIRVVQTMAEFMKEKGEEGDYRFVAIDSSTVDLGKQIKLGYNIRTVELTGEDFDVEKMIGICPYLHDKTEPKGIGAVRDRVYGRFLLDLNMSKVRDKIESAMTELAGKWEKEVEVKAKVVVIWVVHTVGGGTGSGTFPSLIVNVHKLAKEILEDKEIKPFIFCVGILPSAANITDITHAKFNKKYLANSYAALRELELLSDPPQNLKMISFDSGVQSEMEITKKPLNRYFLFGINEDKVGELKESKDIEAVEEYLASSNRVIVNMMYAVQKYKKGVENLWSDEKSPFVAFGESELIVPIEKVKEVAMENDRLGKLLDENAKNSLKEELDILLKTDVVQMNERFLEDKCKAILNTYKLRGLSNFIGKLQNEYNIMTTTTQADFDNTVEKGWNRVKGEEWAKDKIKDVGGLDTIGKYNKILELLRGRKRDNEKVIKSLWPRILKKRLRRENDKIDTTKGNLEYKRNRLGKLNKLKSHIDTELCKTLRDEIKQEKDGVAGVVEYVRKLEIKVKGMYEDLEEMGGGRAIKIPIQRELAEKLTLMDEKINVANVESASDFVKVTGIKPEKLETIVKNRLEQSRDKALRVAVGPGGKKTEDLFFLCHKMNGPLLLEDYKSAFSGKKEPILTDTFDTERYIFINFDLGLRLGDIKEYGNRRDEYKEGKLASKTGLDRIGEIFAYPEWFMDDENVRGVFKKITESEVAGSKTAELPKKEEKPQPHIATKKITDSGRILVDGSNVAWESKKDGKPNIDNIEIIQSELEKKGYNNPIIIVDANLRHIIPEIDKERFEGWIEEEKKVIQTPAGIKADEELLKFADEDENELKIVSNDTFRERENEYPWLNDPSRRVPFRIIENRAILHFR